MKAARMSFWKSPRSPPEFDDVDSPTTNASTLEHKVDTLTDQLNKLTGIVYGIATTPNTSLVPLPTAVPGFTAPPGLERPATSRWASCSNILGICGINLNEWGPAQAESQKAQPPTTPKTTLGSYAPETSRDAESKKNPAATGNKYKETCKKVEKSEDVPHTRKMDYPKTDVAAVAGWYLGRSTEVLWYHLRRNFKSSVRFNNFR